MMDWKRAGQFALFAQDACNGSGLVFDLARTVKQMRAEGMTAEQVQDHPILILFADKLDDLCGCRRYALLPPKKHEGITDIFSLMERFEQTMRELCDNPESTGTDWRNQHGHTRECVLQLVFLTQSRGVDRYSRAYNACKRMEANGQPEPSVELEEYDVRKDAA